MSQRRPEHPAGCEAGMPTRAGVTKGDVDEVMSIVRDLWHDATDPDQVAFRNYDNTFAYLLALREKAHD